MKTTIIPAYEGWRVILQGLQALEAEPVIGWLIEADGTTTPVSPSGPVVSWRYVKGQDGEAVHRTPKPVARPEQETAGGW